MVITTQQIVDEIRGLSGLRRNLYYSDIEISEFVADGGRELGDIFIASFEHHFQTSVDFTLAGGQGGNTFALPDDFQKENLLLLNPTLDAPELVPLLGSQLERAAVGPNVSLWPGGGRRALIADNVLEVLPPSMAAGAYRLLYTPQFSSLAFPRDPDITVGCVAVENVQLTPSDPFAPYSTWAVLPQSFPWIENGVAVATLSPPYMLLSQQDNPSENGVYVVSVDNIGMTATATRLHTLPNHPDLYPTKGQTVLATGGTIGAGYYVETAVVPQPVFNVEDRIAPKVFVPPALPPSLVPWVRYLKVYGALTVRRGRNQPAADLDRELTMLKARASKMAANRTEQPKQAPMQRGRGPWWGTGSTGWR